jgi:hypothetical protein
MKKFKKQLRYYWLHREVVIGVLILILVAIAGLILTDLLIDYIFD